MRSEEISKLKFVLDGRKSQILKNIDSIEKEIGLLSEMDLNDEGDHAAASSNNSLETAIEKKQLQELKEIDLALSKIESNSYGVCDMCEEDISIERLKVKPHAKYCIDCREIAEKNN